MQALRPKEADSQILMEKLLAYDLLLLSVLGLLSARDIAYFLSTSMSISDHFDIKKVRLRGVKDGRSEGRLELSDSKSIIPPSYITNDLSLVAGLQVSNEPPAN